jgi:aminopeptidase YwaD
MTSTERLSQKATAYLHKLCLEIPSRRVGSAGNRTATDFFAKTVASFGFETTCPEFDCIDWSQEGATLVVGGAPARVHVSPYSLGGCARAPLVVVHTVEELEAAELTQRIVLLRGEVAKEQLMPKNFTFYNPNEHKHIIQLLETKQPLAILAATTRNPEMAGAVYPFPLIEDGDFDIPSAYMTAEEGQRVAVHAGEEVKLEVRAERIPATGCNVDARKGASANHRVVLFAHIDAKEGTPGALDDATGVVVLLLVAEMLSGYSGKLGVEIVAVNGEDYYSAPGEQLWLQRNAGRFEEIVAGINLDGAGYHDGRTAYSLYDCPPDVAACIHKAFSTGQGMVEGPAWYQGDHSLFLMNHRPALAITSELFEVLWNRVAHTPKDHPAVVDCGKLVAIALALRGVVLCLDALEA